MIMIIPRAQTTRLNGCNEWVVLQVLSFTGFQEGHSMITLGEGVLRADSKFLCRK